MDMIYDLDIVRREFSIAQSMFRFITFNFGNGSVGNKMEKLLDIAQCLAKFIIASLGIPAEEAIEMTVEMIADENKANMFFSENEL